MTDLAPWLESLTEDPLTLQARRDAFEKHLVEVASMLGPDRFPDIDASLVEKLTDEILRELSVWKP